MAKLNLSRLDFDGLMNLRTQVEHALSAQRSALERQLERLGASAKCPHFTKPREAGHQKTVRVPCGCRSAAILSSDA